MISIRKLILGEKFSLYRYLGVLFSATSAFSLLHRFFEFGLAPLLWEFVSYYRILTDLAFGWISIFVSFEIPPIIHDLWTLSLLGTGVFMRSEAMGEPTNYEGISTSKNTRSVELDANSGKEGMAGGHDETTVVRYLFAAIAAVVLFSGIVLFFAVLLQGFRFDRIFGEPPIHPGPRRKWEGTLEWTAELHHYYEHKQTRLVARIFWETIAVLLLFFALNAFSLSLAS